MYYYQYHYLSDGAAEEHASTNLSTKARRTRRPSLPVPSLWSRSESEEEEEVIGGGGITLVLSKQHNCRNISGDSRERSSCLLTFSAACCDDYRSRHSRSRSNPPLVGPATIWFSTKKNTLVRSIGVCSQALLLTTTSLCENTVSIYIKNTSEAWSQLLTGCPPHQRWLSFSLERSVKVALNTGSCMVFPTMPWDSG